jgi:hypothetical protein
MDADRLAQFDAEGYTALLAIAYDRGPKQASFAYPHAFVCEDGATYWVKRFQHGSFHSGAAPPDPGAQDGLVAELVAGRLGSGVGAAAGARVIEVPSTRHDQPQRHLQAGGQEGMDRVEPVTTTLSG